MDKSELGIKALDDYTLEVTLNVPVSYFLSLMYFPTFYPVNQAFYESVGDTFATSPESILSNGAFVLDAYEPAATAFHLTKNPDYYNADSVQLAGLNYQVIQDSQQALMSYQTGDLDITLVNGEQVDQVKDDPEFTTIGAGYLWYVSPNMDAVPELANLNIRLAMTYLSMWVTGNSNNYGLWSNAEYDAIIAECTTGDLCTDAEGRWARLYDAEKIVMDEAVIFPLYAQCNAEMVSSNVSGIEFHPVALNRVYKNAVKAE